MAKIKSKKDIIIGVLLVYFILLVSFLGGILIGYWYGTSQQEAVLFTQLAIRDYNLEDYMCMGEGRVKINLPENISKEDIYGNSRTK